jgi:5,10-methylenetetrahydromethanopterin reductase
MGRGLAFPGGGMAQTDMIAIAQEAEAAGMDSLYVTEAWRSAFVPLTALALSTERVRLGTYVINAYGRSPFVAGMSAVDVDELSGGRLMLGVGSGNRFINADWQGIPHERPYQKMKEYVELLRQIFHTKAGERVLYEGEIHRMNWVPAVTPVRENVPIYMSAVFPRMIKVAGRVADGLAMGAILSAEYARDVIQPAARAAAEEAGRDPQALGFLMGAMVAVDDDREKARHAAREAICRLFSPLPHPYYEFMLREHGFSAAADAACKHVPEGNMEKAIEAMPDEAVDRLTIAGTPDECRKRLADYNGIVDEVICVNVFYSATEKSSMLDAYRSIINL